MHDKSDALRHIWLEAFRQDKLAPIPVQTSSSKYKLGIVIEILEIVVCEFSSLPTYGLPTVEQCNAAAY